MNQQEYISLVETKLIPALKDHPELVGVNIQVNKLNQHQWIIVLDNEGYLVQNDGNQCNWRFIGYAA